MWVLDHKESWALKNWCVELVLEKILERTLDSKENKSFDPKENQPWLFTGRTDAKAEPPILWPPDAKNWLIRKDPVAGKDWGQEEKGMMEDELVGWHHWLDGHEFEQALGFGEEEGSLACCSSWSHKELDMTELLNWTSRKLTLNTHWKNWCWTSNTLAFWCEKLTHWKRFCWAERLKAKEERGNRGWDG